MTVPATTRKAGPFTGTGLATVYPFGFKIFAVTDVAVVVADATGTESVLATGYTVTKNTDQVASPGGSVTLVSALPLGYKLSVVGALPYDQTLAIPGGGNYNPVAHENALDRIVEQVQQLVEGGSRVLTLPVNSTASPTLPAPQSNTFLAWNADGTVLQNIDPTTLITIGAYGTAKADIFSGTGAQTVFTLSANPGAQNNLDVSIGGVTQRPGTDYTWASGTTITFTAAPVLGTNNVLVRYLQALPQGTIDYYSVTNNPIVDLKRSGAAGDGVADDTSAIQAVINSGAKGLTSAAGLTYRITSQITINTDNLTLDLNGSTLLLDDASGLKSHLFIGNGSTQRNGVKIKNVVFQRAQAATAGYAIDMNLVGVCEIYGCRIYGNSKIFNGIRITRGIIININNNYIDNCINTGIYLIGAGASTKTIDVMIRENRVEGGVTTFATGDFVEGIFVRDNIFFNSSGDLVSLTATTNPNGLASFKIQENDFDTSGGKGLFIDNISNIQVTGNWFSSNTGISLDLGSGVDGIVVSDNQIYPSNHGVRVAGINVVCDSNLFSGGLTQVLLQSTASSAHVSNNRLSGGQYGIDITSNPVGIHVIGNTISGQSIGSLNGFGGAGSVIQNNSGDAGVGSNAFITVGASPFTYTAGPRSECVSVFGGTVSAIAVGGNNIGFATNRTITLAPNQAVVVTYTGIPFMTRNTL